jgi:glycosyltransferase involved in cell wall biosynthesis
MFRILYQESAHSIGGSVFSLLQLVKGLDGKRFKPFVLFRYDLPVRAEYEAAGISTATFTSIGEAGSTEESLPVIRPARPPGYKETGFYRFLWSARRYMAEERRQARSLSRWIKGEGFDLVHANNSIIANIPVIAAAKWAGVPALSHQRGFFRFTPVQRFLTRHAERYICVSNALASHCADEGLPPEKLTVIYNGVDTGVLRPLETSVGDGRPVVGSFGRLEEIKGIDSFLQAAKIVLDMRGDVRFVIGGTGPEEESLREMAHQLGLEEENVEFLGFRCDAASLLARCDIVALTSVWPEALPRSGLEALACGVPLVASRCGGNIEVVQDGDNGILYEPGNAQALANAVLKLLEDSAMRQRFGKASRRRAEKLFAADRHISAVEQLYTEILTRRKGEL